MTNVIIIAVCAISHDGQAIGQGACYFAVAPAQVTQTHEKRSGLNRNAAKANDPENPHTATPVVHNATWRQRSI